MLIKFDGLISPGIKQRKFEDTHASAVSFGYKIQTSEPKLGGLFTCLFVCLFNGLPATVHTHSKIHPKRIAGQNQSLTDNMCSLNLFRWL